MNEVWVIAMVGGNIGSLELSICVFRSREGAEKYIREVIEPDEDPIIVGPETEVFPPEGEVYWLLVKETIKD